MLEDDYDLQDGFDTPEEAARGDIPEQFVTVLGVRIEGDRAHVWSLTNDRPCFEPYEDFLVRRGSKWFPDYGTGGFSLVTPAHILEKAARLGYPRRPRD
jgi:hypothetical protein